MSVASVFAKRERWVRLSRKTADLRALRPGVTPPPGRLMDFVPRISPGLRAPTHLEELVGLMERAADEPVECCFSVPVRHGKTMTLKHGVAWWLARDPTEKILYCSYAHNFAEEQVDSIHALAAEAGVTMGKVQRRDYWTTAAGGFVMAAGIGGQLTGRGFTKIVVDDPHKNREEAESRVMREKVVERFMNDVYTRRDRRGTSFIVVAARWNVNDLIGVLTRGTSPFPRYNFPAIDEQGRALAPWMLRGGIEELLAIKERVGPYVWASLYQGEPRPRGGALFVDVTLVERLPEVGAHRVAIGVDLARTARQRSDHHAAVVLRRELATGAHDVLDVVRHRGTITDRTRGDELVDQGFVHQLARLVLAHPGAPLVMYAAAGEQWLLDFVARAVSEVVRREVRIEAMAIEARDKWMRAQRYAAAWNSGMVRVPSSRDREGWQGDFVLEHVEFQGVHGEENDQVDAAVAAFDRLNPLVEDDSVGLAEAMQAAGKIGRIR